MTSVEKTGLYEFEIERFKELLDQDKEYAFRRYGLTLLYSLKPESTHAILQDLGWKNRDALDYFNQGVILAQEGKPKEALDIFEKSESMKCERPELFYNIAAIAEEEGDNQKAKVYYQRYIDAVEKWNEIPRSLQKDLDETREHLKSMG